MKLLRIHVENFGKLNNLTLNFNDGINVIKEPNAWGKSTIAAFIKVMLYGFEPKKAPGALMRERGFYTPWQGGVFGGELDFAVGNRSYRISRTFGATEKTDVCHVYDLETMLESVDFGPNVGEQLFDLDSNSFKRSVFIAQNDCESRTSDAINAKLGNLAANTNDINNYETAQEDLKNMANSLTPNRATGSLKRRKAQILELEEATRGKAAAEESLEKLTAGRREIEDEKKSLSEQRDDLAKKLKLASEDSRRKEQQKRYLSLCEDLVAKLEALNEFSESFPIGVPEEDEFKNVMDDARSLEEKELRMAHLALSESEQATYDKYAEMFASGIPTELEIDEEIMHYNAISDLKEEKTRFEATLEERERSSVIVDPLPQKPRRFPPLFVFAFVLEIIGLLAFGGAIACFLILKTSPFLMFVGVCLMIIATALFFVSAGIQKKDQAKYETKLEAYRKKQQEQMDEITGLKKKNDDKNSEIHSVQDKADAFLKRYQVFCGPNSISSALYELKNQAKDYIHLNDRVRECDQLKLNCRELQSRLNSFQNAWEISAEKMDTQTLIDLQTRAAKCRSAQQEAVRSKQKKEDFEAVYDVEDMAKAGQSDQDLEEINSQIKELDERLEQVRQNLDQNMRQTEDLKETLDRLDERDQELTELRAIQEEESARFHIISLTQSFLQTAKEHFTARYMAPISEAFRKYYSQIIVSRGDDWVIDANVALRRREQGELREVGQLSAGYQDLIGVCMRLALVDAMYQEEKPFLVLDDPFVNLDEEKTKKGMGLLEFVGEEYQTIYFTCHNSRTPE